MEQNNDKEVISIAGVGKNNAIGRGGDLPWPNIPTDKKYFATETMGHDVVMGSKSFWSIPPQYRPLKGRTNIVVTRNLEGKEYPEGVIVVSSIAEAIERAPTKKVFLIGGGRIYSEGMQFAQKLLITRIFYDDGIPCDVFFPPITDEWKQLPRGPKIVDEKSDIQIQFETWINTKNPPPSFYE